MAARLKQTKTLPEVRIKRIYNQDPETQEQLLSRVPTRYHDVICPECGATMVVVKAKQDLQYGHNITLQCHASTDDKKRPMCLTTMTVTTLVNSYLRAGDFDQADIGWREGAKECPKVDEVAELVSNGSVKPTEAFTGVVEKPIYPGNRETLNLILWNRFWQDILDTGKCYKADLDDYVKSVKDDTPKTRNALVPREIMNLIRERSGYLVRFTDGYYIISGKGRGGKGIAGLPYSDEAYRKRHGFPL